MLNSSSKAVVVTEQGSAIKTRAANVRRIADSLRVPRSPDGSATSKSEWRDLLRWCLPGRSLMETKKAEYFRRADFDQWRLSEGVLGAGT